MSAEEIKPWVAYKPKASNSWWEVARGGEGSYGTSMTFYGESTAEAESKEAARIFNLGDKADSDLKKLNTVRAFIAAHAFHCNGNKHLEKVCNELLDLLSVEDVNQ
jgi:hypothetical protein